MRYGGLIIAIVIAAIAAFVVLKMSGGEKPAPVPQQVTQEIKSTNIYVAAKSIPIGTVLTDDMIAVQPWPEHLMVEGFVLSDGQFNPVGMVARGQYQQNEPLMQPKLANPSDPNFLAGELPAGMRVVTIPINEIDGVAGFVFPGDHVDLILTHEVDKWVMPPSSGASAQAAAPQLTKATVTETLLTNVKVLAVDQRASSVGSTDKDGKLLIPKSASLMVSQEDSQRVRLAQRTGTVSLVLRALSDRDAQDTLLFTQKKDISQAESSDDDVTAPDFIKIVRGAPTTAKENEANTETSRGAPSTTGSLPGNPITRVPDGNSVVNPALVAIP